MPEKLVVELRNFKGNALVSHHPDVLLSAGVVLVSHAFGDQSLYNLTHVLNSLFELLVLICSIQAVAKRLLELRDGIFLR